MKWCTEKNISR